MPEQTTEAQEWADDNMTHLQQVLSQEGASEMMRSLVRERVPHRHSVVEEIHKWYDLNNEAPMREAVETAMRLGGGFFSKVWDGDYAEAYLHADPNNRRIIEQAYNKQFVSDNADSGYLGRVVREKWGRR